MKSILTFFCLALSISSASAQFSELEKEFMAFEQTHEDSLAQNVYIDSSFCSKYYLKNITQKFKRMNVWQSQSKSETNGYMRICDIRWQFKDNFEATSFHNKFISVNSEFGEEIKNSGILIDNTTHLKIFRENGQARKMNESFGSPMNFYYFIFVVDNYVAKVFVNTKTNITVDQAVIFAKEAARKLNENKTKSGH